jgi:F420-dependent oxidoreductase-like protein
MFGVHAGLHKTSVEELRGIWQRAEQLGFDFVSVWDHLYSADLSGPDCLEAVTTHTALAMSTDRVRVGSLVYSVGFRHPAVLAKMIAGIDRISGGRAELGLGAGWHQGEYQAFGIDFPPVATRLDQLEEAAACIRALLHSPEPVDFEGRWFRLERAECVPRPVQDHLPITIGGGGERRTLRIVARFADVWNVPFVPPDEYARKVGVLHDHCAAVGREPADIRCSVNIGLATSEENLTEQFGAIAPVLRPGVLMGSDDEMRDAIGRYREAGADQLNLAIRAPFDLDVIERFAGVALV